MKKMSEEGRERVFWEYVCRRGPDECWFWKGCKSQNGYGSFRFKGRMMSAHRVSWILTNGFISRLFEGLPAMILHQCDNPSCVNPDHLFLGNNKINQKDCVKKGRHRTLNQIGEDNLSSKLLESQVEEIKQYLRDPVLSQQRIADLYNVSSDTISLINTGRAWSHIML